MSSSCLSWVAVPLAERALAVVEDEDVVRRDMLEAVEEAALREVDLLAVARREALVEVADELEGLAPDVDAVAESGRDLRPKPERPARIAAAAASIVQSCGSIGWAVADREPRGSFRGSSARSRWPFACRRTPRREGPRASQPRRRIAVDDHGVARVVAAKAEFMLATKPRFAGWRRR